MDDGECVSALYFQIDFSPSSISVLLIVNNNEKLVDKYAYLTHCLDTIISPKI